MSSTNPDHYSNGGGVETIDVIASMGWLRDFARGNILKYITRYQDKGGIEDLAKARTYIDFLIASENGHAPSSVHEVGSTVNGSVRAGIAQHVACAFMELESHVDGDARGARVLMEEDGWTSAECEKRLVDTLCAEIAGAART